MPTDEKYKCQKHCYRQKQNEYRKLHGIQAEHCIELRNRIPSQSNLVFTGINLSLAAWFCQHFFFEVPEVRMRVN